MGHLPRKIRKLAAAKRGLIALDQHLEQQRELVGAFCCAELSSLLLSRLFPQSSRVGYTRFDCGLVTVDSEATPSPPVQIW